MEGFHLDAMHSLNSPGVYHVQRARSSRPSERGFVPKSRYGPSGALHFGGLNPLPLANRAPQTSRLDSALGYSIQRCSANLVREGRMIGIQSDLLEFRSEVLQMGLKAPPLFNRG